MNGRLVLKRGKDRPLRLRHPWIFSGAIEQSESAGDGETIDILSREGEFLARGYFNSRSQIAARVWTFDDEPIDRTFFSRRLEQALRVREQLGLEWRGKITNAFRLVNAESDFLPGLIVDAYDEFLVVQFLTLGVERYKEEIVGVLESLFHPRGIYERSDVDVRAKEGLNDSVGELHGAEPPDRVEIVENGLTFGVDVKRGHKTGFYLDQRDSRQRVAGLVSSLISDRTRPNRVPEGANPSAEMAFHLEDEFQVLNAFSYTGGFGVYVCAANPRARVLNLDASADVLALAKENFDRNGFDRLAEFVTGDAFAVLRKYRDQARQFDVIILDPPKFVHTKGQLEAGCRGYKDLNLLAFKLLRAGGYLVTFSCSGLVSAELFRKVVFDAATDAQRDVQILTRLGHAGDHPVLLSFPEGEYLKGLVLRVT